MGKASLSVDETVTMMVAVADKIIASEPVLTDADRALGDGDHGVGMERGMKAVKEKLAEGGFATVDKVFIAVGVAMMSSMGGASGAIFGTLFRAGGKGIGAREQFDAEAVAQLLDAGCEGVMKRGGANPGDKTMIDALDPARKKAAELRDTALDAALDAVAGAAEAGRDASEGMIATMGRAKTLGEGSLGKPDAGAVSVAIIMRAMADFVANS